MRRFLLNFSYVLTPGWDFNSSNCIYVSVFAFAKRDVCLAAKKINNLATSFFIQKKIYKYFYDEKNIYIFNLLYVGNSISFCHYY
jgi:hypothetical protein